MLTQRYLPVLIISLGVTLAWPTNDAWVKSGPSLPLGKAASLFETVTVLNVSQCYGKSFFQI